MSFPFIVVGAGGHALVVADALLASGQKVIGFTDADASRHGQRLCGLSVLGKDEDVLAEFQPTQVRLANGIGGVGGASRRQGVQHRLEARGWVFGAVQHPSSIASPFACIGRAAQLLARSVVQPGAVLGDGCIVNTGAVVEHDCLIGDFVHVAPGALLCGGVRVAALSHIGAGAVILQSVQLGPDTIVGAGAVVIRDFVGAGTLIGSPAKRMEARR